MANRNLTSVVYTDDEGNQYATKMDASVFAQANTAGTGPRVGGTDYDGNPRLPPLPVNLIPRHAIVSSAGNKRRVILLDKANTALETGDDTTINLPVLGAAAVAYTVSRINQERWKRRPSADD